MKKYIIVFLFLFTPCVTHAITMCAKNNSLVGSVRQTTVGTITATFSQSEPLWRIGFPWGTIFGESTQLSAAEGGEPSGSFSITNVDGNMIPMDTPAGLVGNDENGNPREYCWCRMTHPMISRWMAISSNTDCNYKCMYEIRYNLYSGRINAQTTLFRSVFDTLADED